MKTPAAALHALPEGPDWRAAPFLVQGTAPSIYVLDLAPSTPPGTEQPAGPQSDGATAMAPAADPAVDLSAPPAADAGGCQLAPAQRRSSNGGLAGGVAFAMLCLIAARLTRARAAARHAAHR